MKTGPLDARRLYLCTPIRPDLELFLARCIEGGVDIVQLREKSATDAEIVSHAKLALKVCAHYGVPFVLNDRADLALEAGANGVHLGQDDALVSTARAILGPDAIVGLSTHGPADLKAASYEPVDYISAGPVVPTPTKPARPGTGMEYIRQVAASESRAWFVTGAVTPDAINDLAANGAERFVVVRYLTQAPDAFEASTKLSEAISACLDR